MHRQSVSSYLRLSISYIRLRCISFLTMICPVAQWNTTPVSTMIKQILYRIKEFFINPCVEIIAAMVCKLWMKDNNSSKGGSLKSEYYEMLTPNYFVKYTGHAGWGNCTITAVAAEMDSWTLLTQSVWHGAQAGFVETILAFWLSRPPSATKLLRYDHNRDHADYPLTVLNGTAANAFTDGSAFHFICRRHQLRSSGAPAGLKSRAESVAALRTRYTTSSGDFGGWS